MIIECILQCPNAVQTQYKSNQYKQIDLGVAGVAVMAGLLGTNGENAT